jgi:hypothetical protein
MNLLPYYPDFVDYTNFIIYSSGANLSFLFTISFTLSFSNFSNYSSDLLLINSVNAASYIISYGVNLSFFNNSYHFDYASIPNTLSHSGFAKDPGGALGYLFFFFFSPDSS